NSTKSGLRNFIRALQTEFGRHRQTFLGGSSAPVLDPRVIGVSETSLGGHGDDLMHATSLPTLASLADWSRVRSPVGPRRSGDVVAGGRSAGVWATSSAAGGDVVAGGRSRGMSATRSAAGADALSR